MIGMLYIVELTKHHNIKLNKIKIKLSKDGHLHQLVPLRMPHFELSVTFEYLETCFVLTLEAAVVVFALST
jgi:hypothetical protein